MSEITFVAADTVDGAHWRRVTVLREDELYHYDEFRRFVATALGLDGRTVPDSPARFTGPSGALYEIVVTGRAGAPFPSGVEINAIVENFAAVDDDAVDRDLWALLRWLYDGVGHGWAVDDLEATGRLYHLPFVATERTDQ